MHNFSTIACKLKVDMTGVIGLPTHTASLSLMSLFPFLPSRSIWHDRPATTFPLKPKGLSVDNKSAKLQYMTKPKNIYCKLSTASAPLETGPGEGILFQKIRAAVDPYVYTVYNLSEEDFSSDIWQASTAILVLYEPEDPDSANSEEIEKLSDYLCSSDGKVLLILSAKVSHPPFSDDRLTIGNLLDRVRAGNFDKLSPQIATKHWRWNVIYSPKAKPLLGLYEQANDVSPSLVAIKIDEVEAFPQQLTFALTSLGAVPHPEDLETEDVAISKPSPFFSYDPNHNQQRLAALKKLLESPDQKFIVSGSLATLPPGFHWEDYFSRLNTKLLGRSPVWADILPSSYTTCQSILPSLSKESGLMIVSSVQTAGIGRRSNQWISPRGMACFSFHTSLPFSSGARNYPFAQLLSWLQHLASLAVLMSLRQLFAESLGIDWLKKSCNEQKALCHIKLPGPQILIKWPNDVYVVESPDNPGCGDGLFSKLCGILVSVSSSHPQQFSSLFGIGINVANQKPTVCLHDVIRMVAREEGIPAETLQLPSTAAVIACTLNHLEKLLVLFETNSNGLQTITNMYTSCWVHSNQKVRILKTSAADRGVDDELTVIGVDEFGFLRVEDKFGISHVLHPNGNSIDMLEGLIIPRPSTNA